MYVKGVRTGVIAYYENDKEETEDGSNNNNDKVHPKRTRINLVLLLLETRKTTHTNTHTPLFVVVFLCGFCRVMITMAQNRRTKKPSRFASGSSLQLPLTIVLFCILFSLIVYVAIAPEQPVPSSPSSLSLLRGAATGTESHIGAGATSAAAALAMGPVALEFAEAAVAHDYSKVAHLAQHKLQSTVQHQREQLTLALNSLTTSALPIGRLRVLRDKHQIVGERLGEIKSGKETVEEVLHGSMVPPPQQQHAVTPDKPPMELDEIIDYLTNWIHTLHDALGEAKHANFEQIWQAYHDLTVKTLYPWDREYLSRMPVRRNDGSIFLSLATYRDENCFNTIRWAYEKAKHPELLFVGLIQQNCHADCISGILDGGGSEPVEPDQDCYQAFCETPQGQEICARNQVRKSDIDEPESLGPYAARYFASKLWYGEQWFMQTDAHMTFAQDWDATSVQMLQAAPSDKPVISHYPPSHLVDLEEFATKPGSRLCGPMFATSDLESQIIRLEGASVRACRAGFCPGRVGSFVSVSAYFASERVCPWICTPQKEVA
jgi:Glycosyltransferase (GlcNAc)